MTQKSQQLRLNYLLIPIFEAVLAEEMLDRAPLIEGEDYHPYIFGKDCQMLSIYIFRRVFKSDQRNIDTICCIACQDGEDEEEGGATQKSGSFKNFFGSRLPQKKAKRAPKKV